MDKDACLIISISKIEQAMAAIWFDGCRYAAEHPDMQHGERQFDNEWRSRRASMFLAYILRDQPIPLEV